MPGDLLDQTPDRLMAATASGRTAAKKPPKPSAPAADGGGPASGHAPLGFDVLRLVRKPRDDEPERIPVFAITGDDGKETVYTVPAKPDFSVAVEYGYRAGRDGVPVALDWLLDEMLGVDGYHALRTYPDLTPEHFGEVIRIVTALATGPAEAPKEL